MSALLVAACFAGGPDAPPPAEPSQADAAVEPVPATDSATLSSCEVIDAELSQNCEINRACASFSGEQQTCVSDLLALLWSRPPCEEYAACLGIPLFDCVDVDAELSQNCGIESACQQMSWGERFCLSDLMSMDWSQPPCEEYAQCLVLD